MESHCNHTLAQYSVCVYTEYTNSRHKHLYIRTHTAACIRVYICILLRWSSMEHSMCQSIPMAKEGGKSMCVNLYVFMWYLLWYYIYTERESVFVCALCVFSFRIFSHFTLLLNAHTLCCVVLYCSMCTLSASENTLNWQNAYIFFLSCVSIPLCISPSFVYIAIDFARLPSPVYASFWILVHNFFLVKKKL